MSYQERRNKIVREAIQASKAAARNSDTPKEDDIQSLATWIGPFHGGKCTFYQDRDKRYPFDTNERGYQLLQALMERNRTLLQINQRQIEEHAVAASDDNVSPDVVVRIGHGLYADKPTLRTQGVTWSTEEYSHPGLQRMYLRLKSIQRFTEVWALLERSYALGVFAEVDAVVRVAAVGGGPGFELLATKLFFEQRFPQVEKLELICMDACPAWRPYAEELGFRFLYYDINNQETNPLEVAGLERGQLHFCIVSCVMIYVTNNQTLDMFHRLVHEDGVGAILLSERGEKTRACTMFQDRGGSAIRLLDQAYGIDERQAILCSNEFKDSHLSQPNDKAIDLTFPNVPYMEHKVDRQRFARSRRS